MLLQMVPRQKEVCDLLECLRKRPRKSWISNSLLKLRKSLRYVGIWCFCNQDRHDSCHEARIFDIYSFMLKSSIAPSKLIVHTCSMNCCFDRKWKKNLCRVACANECMRSGIHYYLRGTIPSTVVRNIFVARCVKILCPQTYPKHSSWAFLFDGVHRASSLNLYVNYKLLQTLIPGLDSFFFSALYGVLFAWNWLIRIQGT